MRFHLPSFLLGYVSGGATVLFARRLRPIAIELASAGYRLLDRIGARLSSPREELDELLSEARSRARGVHVTVGAHA